ncbi:hypothetical protein J1N35_008845 [Gossypium stocksii]|uniref:Reverse transcriptase zinc-binding domain-containing protein n=1 Tax=Gossypium stocksii TaxID=47602 RepID=A0A9D4AEU6_9ROSI|nr:hypothetical protein J1N35_008845 [Gossypium stocksii]
MHQQWRNFPSKAEQKEKDEWNLLLRTEHFGGVILKITGNFVYLGINKIPIPNIKFTIGFLLLKSGHKFEKVFWHKSVWCSAQVAILEHSFISWLAVAVWDQLLTKSWPISWGCKILPDCLSCAINIETGDHIFHDCSSNRYAVARENCLDCSGFKRRVTPSCNFKACLGPGMCSSTCSVKIGTTDYMEAQESRPKGSFN